MALHNTGVCKFTTFVAMERWSYSPVHQEDSILRKAITGGWVNILSGVVLVLCSVLYVLHLVITIDGSETWHAAVG